MSLGEGPVAGIGSEQSLVAGGIGYHALNQFRDAQSSSERSKLHLIGTGVHFPAETQEHFRQTQIDVARRPEGFLVKALLFLSQSRVREHDLGGIGCIPLKGSRLVLRPAVFETLVFSQHGQTVMSMGIHVG